jgi:hypothetical protein
MHAKSAAVSKSELPLEETKTTNAAYERDGLAPFSFPANGPFPDEHAVHPQEPERVRARADEKRHSGPASVEQRAAG